MGKRSGSITRFVRVLLIVFVLLIVIVAGIELFPGTAKPGFQEYKPAFLPAGLRTTNAELYILKYPQLAPKFNKHINVNFGQPNSWIEEEKNTDPAFFNTWCETYQKGSKCTARTTKGGQTYLLSDDTSVQEVYFIKNKTSIWITLRKLPLTPETWDKIVDSFQPTVYSHPKIFRGSTQGP